MIANAALQKIWTVITAATWATVGGGVGAVVAAVDDARVYEGPPDWAHLRKLFITGAILGFIGWCRKEKALATPVPATAESDAADAAALKRAAVAQDSDTVIHIREVL